MDKDKDLEKNSSASCCSSKESPPAPRATSCCSSKELPPAPRATSCCSSKESPPAPATTSCCSSKKEVAPSPSPSSCCSSKKEEPVKTSCCGGSTNHKTLSVGEGEEGGYYCPMFCEGEKIYPESTGCPICGMDLVATAIEEGSSDGELASLKKRFLLALLFSLPLMVLSMGEMVPGVKGWLPAKEIGDWLQLFLSLPVVFYAGWDFLVRGFRSLKTMHYNMWTLIMLGVTAAFIFSVVALFFPQIFPESFRDHHGSVHLYFESATMILTLVLFGQVLEVQAHSKTQDALKSLLELAPSVAHRLRGDEVQEIEVKEVEVGDLLRVLAGEKVPVDGVLVETEIALDESMVTGESMPVAKQLGDLLLAGTLNGQTPFVMRAQKVGSQTLLAQMIDLVQKASRSKAPVQSLADRFSRYFVQVVVTIAILTFIAWSMSGVESAYAYAFANSIAVLVVACPCALGLATPISVMVGMGRAAQKGLLIKDAKAIESMEMVDTLIVDKTGTLTEGKPCLEKIHCQPALEEKRALSLIASLESYSEHPLKKVFDEEAKQRGLTLFSVEDFKTIVGRGIVGTIEGERYHFGSPRWLKELGVTLDPEMVETLEGWQSQAQTVMLLAKGTSFLAMVGVVDPVKESSKEAIKLLEREQIKVIMMTGDNQRTAQAVAERLGIKEFYADCLPDQKYQKVMELQESGRVVMMAGDGINDAPALAQADIGLAMGQGADIAMENAQVVLLQGDLKGISQVCRLSHKMMSNIRQNLFFAFLYNGLGVPIAAGILYPFFGLLMSPMIAAGAMSLSSVSVISNALRLRNA